MCAVGLATPAGLTALESRLSFEAGICAYRSSQVQSRRRAPMTLALLDEEYLPAFEPGPQDVALTTRQVRMLRLAKLAFDDLAGAFATHDAGLADAPLFLAGAEDHRGHPSPLRPAFFERLQQHLGLEPHPASACWPLGRAAAFHALAAAIEHLERTPGGVAIVGGLDSGLDLRLLGLLDHEDRVLGEGVMDGFAPGEAAAFLALTRDPARAPLATVHAPGLAEEPGHRYSDEPYLGAGLDAAVGAALEGDPATVERVYTSFNGESFSAKEWGVASMRHGERFAEELDVQHPAECFGDTGGATAAVQLALAAISAGAEGAPRCTLVWSSSDGPARGAALVLPPDGQSQSERSLER